MRSRRGPSTGTLAQAQVTLDQANIGVDAPCGEIQYAERNGDRIPTPETGECVRFPFTGEEIAADPELRTLRLTE